MTYVPLSNAYRVATTVYDIPLMHMRCRVDGDQHGADRAVPRRRPAGGDAGAGAADRSRRRAARHGPREAAAEEPDHAQEAALPHRQRAALRQRRFHRQHEAHGRGRRLEGLRGAAARIQEARQAARHRHLELCRDAGRHSARARRGHGAAGRQGRACGRHAIDRPGPRDHVRAGDGRPARRASGGHQVHRRRHRANRRPAAARIPTARCGSPAR